MSRHRRDPIVANRPVRRRAPLDDGTIFVVGLGVVMALLIGYLAFVVVSS